MILLVIIGGLMMLLAILYALIIFGALTGLSLPSGNITSSPGQLPVVSVIIPVRNEENRLLLCLASLSKQDYPFGKVELLISDDFSEDRTCEIAERFIQQHPQQTWILVKGDPELPSGSGKKAAIARAIHLASGSLILTTDGDTQHSSSWISSMVHGYHTTGARMVLGPVMFSETKGVFGHMQTLEFLGVMGLTAGFANIGRAIMCNGANLCYEKTTFYQTGGFDGNEQFASGDDQFLLWKIKRLYGGGAIRFLDDRDAIVTTLPAQGVKPFFQQRFRWISKSRGYRDPLVTGVGLVSYLFQAMILAGFSLGFLSPLYLYLAVLLLAFKLLIDLPLVFSMARFFNKLNLWKWYIPAQLFQVLYVTVSGPMAFLIPVKWKGRRVSSFTFRIS
ncbi:MAG: glycosyltransferase [Bacteroidales bacterium]|nr:glycosyltransferase [Bacteroidales bacterium]